MSDRSGYDRDDPKHPDYAQNLLDDADDLIDSHDEEEFYEPQSAFLDLGRL